MYNFPMSIESHLVIGKNPYTEEAALAINPRIFSPHALKMFITTLVNCGKQNLLVVPLPKPEISSGYTVPPARFTEIRQLPEPKKRTAISRLVRSVKYAGWVYVVQKDSRDIEG